MDGEHWAIANSVSLACLQVKVCSIINITAIKGLGMGRLTIYSETPTYCCPTVPQYLFVQVLMGNTAEYNLCLQILLSPVRKY